MGQPSNRPFSSAPTGLAFERAGSGVTRRKKSTSQSAGSLMASLRCRSLTCRNSSGWGLGSRTGLRRAGETGDWKTCGWKLPSRDWCRDGPPGRLPRGDVPAERLRGCVAQEAVSFRTKLLLIFTLTVTLAVGLVAAIVSASMRRAFEQVDAERTSALVAQFEREFARQGEEVTRRVEGVARADSVQRMAVDLNRPRPDYSLYVETARDVAAAQRLDFL